MGQLSPIETSCYFGSLNIFSFINESLKEPITEKCLKYAVISNNTNIINKCLQKTRKFDQVSMDHIVGSHNNTLLKFILDKNLYDPLRFDGDFDDVNKARNLKAVFMMFEKNKNSIIPWFAEWPQAFDIITKENIDYLRITSKRRNLLHFAASGNNAELCKFLIEKIRFKPDSKDVDYYTPLHMAAYYDSKEAAEILVKHGQA
ncbi:hypothetical protein TVAG_303390 [Trichomonas vaginalis G3]|uniref:DUF3447 domain-containing protein n=1 Tax=Trichomonas vaginalis (strain ATCC PRA-98 / G3) TaxID=412133 RepID=A2DR21_TRIV3|nr:spectrin binding [Trichomonas vaginalis G3]EAY17120.1 hypothetical protein TVAG_303390 [Trichomonas vaginalis G3]KAI5508830.1 spectrin binding [Trichomonas vaginalis G3]|eukprot:XP_001329343.1 hypothetical protein [Trichomonas vaginalis G3]